MTSTPHHKRRRWRRRVGWPLIALGVVLFAYGYIGATTGLVSLPFDRHHVLSEITGVALVLRGLIWALSDDLADGHAGRQVATCCSNSVWSMATAAIAPSAAAITTCAPGTGMLGRRAMSPMASTPGTLVCPRSSTITELSSSSVQPSWRGRSLRWRVGREGRLRCGRPARPR